jgi:amidase
MSGAKWTGRSAVEIAEAVRGGTADPREVVAEHIERIQELAGPLGAFRRVRGHEALAEAEELAARPDLAELPLAGVPVAVKDNVDVAGEQTRNGSAGSGEELNDADAEVVARLRAAGAIVVGLTNVPELCLTGVCDSPYGITRNPWDLALTPGGSSGGSAAAVASALVPLAHGNDGFGSLRIPAACCGLVGFKPGTDVVPATEPTWFGLSENGPLAATVQDAAAGLAVMAGDPDLARLGEPAPLRVGMSVRPLLAGLPVDRRAAAAVHDLAPLLTRLGHEAVVHDRPYPNWLGLGALRTWYASARMSAERVDASRLQRNTRGLVTVGRALEAAHLGAAGSRARWRHTGAAEFFGALDVLALPALTTPPPRAERWSERGVVRNTVLSVRTYGLFAAWNIAGWPAMSIPAVPRPDGTPIGVQLVARPGREKLLLELAAQLEQARPWLRHAPAYRAA